MPGPPPSRSPIRLARLLAKRTQGATAIEYALLLAMIALTIAAGMSQLSSALGGTFDTVRDYMFVAR